MVEINNFRIDQSFCLSKTITNCEISLFAGISGDFHSEHTDIEYVKQKGFVKQVAHEAISVGIINSVLRNQLPGKNFNLLRQQVEYLAPVFEGDTVTAEVKIRNWQPEKRLVTLRLACFNQFKEEVITGEAIMIFQEEK